MTSIKKSYVPDKKESFYFEDMKLDKIIDRYNQIKMIDEQESHSIETQMECKTYSDYYLAGKIAKSLGLERIVDIGCAHGHQSYVITQQGVDYLGINTHIIPFFAADDKARYLVGHYPLEIKTSEKDLAVAILSLFWNCYLYDDNVLEDQIKAVSKDFKYLLASIPNDKIELVGRAFTCYEKIGDLILFRK